MLTEQEERDLLRIAQKMENIKRYEDELHLGSYRIIKEAQDALASVVRKSRKLRKQS